MEDWVNMVSTPEQDLTNGAPFGVSASYSTSGAEASAPEASGSFNWLHPIDSASAAVSGAIQDAEAAASSAIGKAEEVAKAAVLGGNEGLVRFGSWLKWGVVGAVVVGLAVVAVLYAPEVKGVAKAAGVT